MRIAGKNEHKRPLKDARVTLDDISRKREPSRFLERALSERKPANQLGTLGGGNHFIEVNPHRLRSLQLSCKHLSKHM